MHSLQSQQNAQFRPRGHDENIFEEAYRGRYARQRLLNFWPESSCGYHAIKRFVCIIQVESFIVEMLKGQNHPAEQVANQLKDYLVALNVRPGTLFHVAGYAKAAAGLDQTLFFVDPAAGNVSRLNPINQQGANWGGEIDVLQRLLNEVALIQTGGQPPTPLPFHGVPFEFFTLQDAIDFAVYGIRSTIETLRFQAREKTVGGPIDVLVITPDGSKWIEEKQLVANP